MYSISNTVIKKEKAQKKIIFCRRLEGHWRKAQDTDPLVKGIDLNPDPDP